MGAAVNSADGMAWRGDGLHDVVLGVLVAMSVCAWVILCLKAWEHWRFLRVARAWSRAVAPSAPASCACHAAMAHGLRQDDLPPGQRVEQALEAMMHRASWGMVGLSVIASSAPFVGLLGTVWGIYQALLGMSTQQVAALSQVAGPIGQALIMTAVGLAVAIPATVGYNLLVRANKSKQFHAQQWLRRWLAAQA